MRIKAHPFFMAGMDELNKLRGGGYKYVNPYINKDEEPKKPKSVESGKQKKQWNPRDLEKKDKEPFTPPEKGILERDSYLVGRILELQRQLDDMRFDMLTLLDIISNDFGLHTAAEARARYFDFRANPEHIMQRIVDKMQASRDGELNFKDRQDDNTGDGTTAGTDKN